MPNKMTAWGVGRGLGRITYSYLAFTIILHIIRPDIITITQIPFQDRAPKEVLAKANLKVLT